MKLKLPELLRSYRKVLIIYEEHGWEMKIKRNDDKFGLFLWIDIPDYITNDQSDYWKIHQDEIISDLQMLTRYKKLKKIISKME
jgi:hypothetical protein